MAVMLADDQCVRDGNLQRERGTSLSAQVAMSPESTRRPSLTHRVSKYRPPLRRSDIACAWPSVTSVDNRVSPPRSHGGLWVDSTRGGEPFVREEIPDMCEHITGHSGVLAVV